MASPLTPFKRPYEWNPLEPNGRGKLQKTAPFSNTQQNQLKVPKGVIVFRVLCPASKFGSIIGKGGGIVSKIRQETGAKIRIEETVPGCEERVVVITGFKKDAEVRKEETQEDTEETGVVDGVMDTKASNDNDKEKDNSSALEGTKAEKLPSSVQKALLLVYERLVEGESADVNGDEESPVSVRLLILSSQVGCLLGKGGSVIKQMSGDSRAHIQILPKDKLSLCASPTDEIVQIVGGVDSVRKALQSVSQQLLENPPCDLDLSPATNPSGPSAHPLAPSPRPEVLPPTNYHLPVQQPPFPSKPHNVADYHSTINPSFPKFHEGVAPVPIQAPPESISYRLLCSIDKVGSVIGMGGIIVKTIQRETGCAIKILETASESEDRIVVISGPALPGPGDRISPAQEAVLRVQDRIVMAVPDKKESIVLSRLLVSSTQTGCLIGKRGAIIAEMRKLSGAHIRILGKDQIPTGMAENDEVVQITGELRAVKDALLQITSTLRHHLFRDNIPPINHTSHPPVDQIPPFGPLMGAREPFPPRLHSNLTPFQNDSFGRPHEERSAFLHNLHSSAAIHGVEKMPPAPWTPQGMRDSGGSMPIPEYAGVGRQRRVGGFEDGNQPGVITKTLADIVVPRALVPSIYGEDGICLRRIREISEAKITITEPRPEATETVIVISGTPEQTHAAKSLLQAFVLSELGGP